MQRNKSKFFASIIHPYNMHFDSKAITVTKRGGNYYNVCLSCENLFLLNKLGIKLDNVYIKDEAVYILNGVFLSIIIKDVYKFIELFGNERKDYLFFCETLSEYLGIRDVNDYLISINEVTIFYKPDYDNALYYILLSHCSDKELEGDIKFRRTDTFVFTDAEADTFIFNLGIADIISRFSNNKTHGIALVTNSNKMNLCGAFKDCKLFFEFYFLNKKENIDLDCSEMFENSNVNFVRFNLNTYITNAHAMFKDCSRLDFNCSTYELDINMYLKTRDFSYMFHNCIKAKIICVDFYKLIADDVSYMFYNVSSLSFFQRDLFYTTSTLRLKNIKKYKNFIKVSSGQNIMQKLKIDSLTFDFLDNINISVSISDVEVLKDLFGNTYSFEKVMEFLTKYNDLIYLYYKSTYKHPLDYDFIELTAQLDN